jgi:putative FmdB family regulatory protein
MDCIPVERFSAVRRSARFQPSSRARSSGSDEKETFVHGTQSISPADGRKHALCGPGGTAAFIRWQIIVCRFKTTSWTWEITKKQIKTEAAMPLYEYFCKKCKKKFGEILTVKEHDTRKMRCPKCKSEDMEKVIEPFTAVTSKKSGSW